MKKYKCLKGWKRWNPGDAIDEYEYKRLPWEIKQAGNFVEDTPVELLKGYFATVPLEEQVKLEDIPENDGPTIEQFFNQTPISEKLQKFYDTATPENVIEDLEKLGVESEDLSEENTEELEDFVAGRIPHPEIPTKLSKDTIKKRKN